VLPPGPTASGSRCAEGRFAFGDNWRAFLDTIDEARITQAAHSLQTMLELPSLEGRSFLDVGTGSGLFSLAAMRLGAQRIHSFDLDLDSVACAEALRRRFYPNADNWTIGQGSVLDACLAESLGGWDVVYAWGVVHHTGAMWQAMSNVALLVSEDGSLFLAIYNDQGLRSRVWREIKRWFNRLPERARVPYALIIMLPREFLSLAFHLVSGRPHRYLQRWTRYKQERGMSRWHDLVDWVGGYPFEVARPEEVVRFCREEGFELVNLRTCGGRLGCNEYVFRRVARARVEHRTV
jgi:2-polyprenyl-3-methyl-5-hydroxy-6-metoxy-1,4-benzoquinol methylase